MPRTIWIALVSSAEQLLCTAVTTTFAISEPAGRPRLEISCVAAVPTPFDLTMLHTVSIVCGLCAGGAAARAVGVATASTPVARTTRGNAWHLDISTLLLGWRYPTTFRSEVPVAPARCMLGAVAV